MLMSSFGKVLYPAPLCLQVPDAAKHGAYQLEFRLKNTPTHICPLSHCAY